VGGKRGVNPNTCGENLTEGTQKKKNAKSKKRFLGTCGGGGKLKSNPRRGFGTGGKKREKLGKKKKKKKKGQ